MAARFCCWYVTHYKAGNVGHRRRAERVRVTFFRARQAYVDISAGQKHQSFRRGRFDAEGNGGLGAAPIHQFASYTATPVLAASDEEAMPARNRKLGFIPAGEHKTFGSFFGVVALFQLQAALGHIEAARFAKAAGAASAVAAVEAGYRFCAGCMAMVLRCAADKAVMLSSNCRAMVCSIGLLLRFVFQTALNAV